MSQIASSASSLISQKMAISKEVAKSDKIRFMLNISPRSRDDLRKLADSLNTGQIELASELFELCLNDAIKAFTEANKPKV